jgi:hypothetical protein
MESACRAQFDLFERAVPLSLVSQQSSFLAAADPPPSNVSDHGHRTHRPCPCLSRLFAILIRNTPPFSAPSFFCFPIWFLNSFRLFICGLMMSSCGSSPLSQRYIHHSSTLRIQIQYTSLSNSLFCQIKIISHFIITLFIIPRMLFFVFSLL